MKKITPKCNQRRCKKQGLRLIRNKKGEFFMVSPTKGAFGKSFANRSLEVAI